MESCLYEGWVRHRRFGPVEHSFRYRLFMLYLDLEELPRVFKDRWLWSAERPAVARFRRSDHLGQPDEPLDLSVRRLIREKSGKEVQGPVRLLTHLAYFGYRFNPVSFYYAFEPDGKTLSAIVAEINNTPWGEQHGYVLAGGDGDVRRFELQKAFHISPFFPMDLGYRWQFSTPAERLSVHMESYEGERLLFDATLSMERDSLTPFALNRRLVAFPWMTFQVVSRIYWQAFRLWWKKAPYYPKPASPDSRRPAEEVTTR
jgi:DUF1365 family protein